MPHRHENSHAIRDHTVLPATRQRWHSRLYSQQSCMALDLVFFPDFCIHTHSFNGPFSGTTLVSRYQKGKTNLDSTEARDSDWQWHQLGHMQVCTSLQTNNHASTPPLSFYRPDALPAAQPTASKHWRNDLCIQCWIKWMNGRLNEHFTCTQL